MPNQNKVKCLLQILLLILLGGIAVGFLSYLFLDLLLPFTAAFFAAVLLSPLSKRIGKKTRMSLRALRLFLLFFLMASLSLLLIFGAIKLIDEAGEFFSSLYSRLEVLFAKLFAFLETSGQNSPTASKMASALSEALKNAMSELSSKSASLAAHLAAKLPSMLFSLFIFLLSLFYFSFDYEAITAYFASLLPKKYREKAERVKRGILLSTKRFLRAYGLLFLLTFGELYVAFLFLKVDSALILALIAATLDILPAVGVGVVLVPWSIALFVSGNTARAITLLVITLAVTLIRQVAEPHIIGKEFGIHPLASLVALYVGLRLLGIIGILISPFLALAVSEAVNLYRNTLSKTN